MKRTAYQPPDSFVPAGRTYSHGIIVEGAARTLYVAGQTSRDRDGKIVCVGDAAGQTRQVLENMKKVIEGGSGVWGPIPMPPHKGKVSDSEAKTLVQWVLAQ